MNKLFIFLLMIFLHIVDDYVLQAPFLSSLKQKDFWKKNAPNDMYKHDYIVALVMHSFSWAFMIMLPIAWVQGFNIGWRFLKLFVFNVAIHAFVDNAKANWKIINLWWDQLAHMLQIVLTFLFLYV